LLATTANYSAVPVEFSPLYRIAADMEFRIAPGNDDPGGLFDALGEPGIECGEEVLPKHLPLHSQFSANPAAFFETDL
jgi:hypothetical protein